MCYVFSTHKEQADVFHLHDFLILDLRKKKERKQKGLIKNEEMHSISGSGTDPHVQVRAYKIFLDPQPIAFPFLRLLAAMEKRPL